MLQQAVEERGREDAATTPSKELVSLIKSQKIDVIAMLISLTALDICYDNRDFELYDFLRIFYTHDIKAKPRKSGAARSDIRSEFRG